MQDMKNLYRNVNVFHKSRLEQGKSYENKLQRLRMKLLDLERRVLTSAPLFLLETFHYQLNNNYNNNISIYIYVYIYITANNI